MKERFLRGWNYLRSTIGLPAMIVIALVGSYFFYSFVRDWRTNREIERQSARIDEYSRQSRDALEKTNQHLLNFERNHQATLALLDTINAMSDNIRHLADNDRVINVRVDALKNDYENVRNQKRTTSTRSNIPVRQREDGVLSADAELYPE